MKYIINKKRLPKKLTDTSIMKCILKAIHDHFHVDCELLHVSKEKYEAYYNYLEQLEIITNVSTKYSPEGYSVLSSSKYKTFLNKKELNLKINVTTPLAGFSIDLNNDSTTIGTNITKN